MKIRAQVAMVMALDKCIGCHTCSVTCKNVWTNRPGAEYMWFNNVETKPGVGYPKEWENQKKWRGGWVLKKGRLKLSAGGRWAKLFQIFYNPDLPTVDDYYEPFTYDYENLIRSPERNNQPVARPRSEVTGKPMEIRWGPNWEDDLSGAPETAGKDPNLQGMEHDILFEYEQSFLLYLPRICEHCLNPSCVASCPSGAIYKREEDGIVLVDEENCRGWRFCVTGCPYKKIYFNWRTHKAEKCTFCYPRIEVGLSTICSETCPGRLRYLGVLLYDADRVETAASVEDPRRLVESQLSLFLDPSDPKVERQALDDGVPPDWVDAAKRSPVYKLCVEWGIALPLQPQFRTLPMVWYVPPLSPLLNRVDPTSATADPRVIFPAIEAMRIPVQYLANLLAAGDAELVRRVLRKLVGLRTYMRSVNLGIDPNADALRAAGLSIDEARGMFRLLSIAPYDERYVIPTSHRERNENIYRTQGVQGLPFAERQFRAEAFHRLPYEDPPAMTTCPVGACGGCSNAGPISEPVRRAPRPALIQIEPEEGGPFGTPKPHP
jgi:nitrate reductase / nitrite oxidoreductase, beta subunit